MTITWNAHINDLTKKIASGIGALKRIRSFAPTKTSKLIFNTLVQPHFNYCCSVWDSCNKTYAEKLQKLQNRAASKTFLDHDANADLLFEKLCWRALSSQRKLQKAVMVYKSRNGLAPDSIFTHRESVTSIQ